MAGFWGRSIREHLNCAGKIILVKQTNDLSSANSGRVALVTGASRGIGACIAELLRDSGYRVASFDRGTDAPEGVYGVACDITDTAAVDAGFSAIEAELGPVEVLIANAGITKDTLLMRMSDEDWDAVINVNLTGAYRVIRRAARSMVKGRYGRIVLMGSVVGLNGSAGQVNYSSTKAGLIGMARSVSRELGARGVTCNVVAPGFIETAMTAVLDDAVVAEYKKQIPLGRMGSTEDVAKAVRFLVSDDASYITGCVLGVDGGLGMGH